MINLPTRLKEAAHKLESLERDLKMLRLTLKGLHTLPSTTDVPLELPQFDCEVIVSCSVAIDIVTKAETHLEDKYQTLVKRFDIPE